MTLLKTALVASTLVAGVASAVFAQSATTPVQTNPNTKVYAYKQTAPATATPRAASQMPPAASPRMDPDVPAYGSAKWWELINRRGHGSGD
ncbi:MAG TPA: hypothetical protein VJ740_18165 [Hyphomicrobiaceae bacterium]|jgi:hypothetical protein|nr:hypothetical protein [Hyphomicrobiaceae bacterium]